MAFLESKKRKQQNAFDDQVNLAIGAEIERFGAANAEHFASYAELRHISEGTITRPKSDYPAQAGYSAEVKQAARVNAKSIIDNESTRIARTENVGLSRQHPYDHVEVDEQGIPKKSSDGSFVNASQQKTAQRPDSDLYRKLYNGSKSKDGQVIYDKYKDAARLDVPPDHYPKIIENIDNDIDSLEKQKTALLQNNEPEKVQKIQKQIEQRRDVRKRLKASEVSSHDAMEARKSPTWSTVKDVGKISHKAGVKSAQLGAGVGGAISAVKNTKAFIDGDKSAVEAAGDVVKDTGQTAAKAYVSGAASAAIGGALKSSSSQICKNLARKSGPTAILQTGVILAKQTTKLIAGKITPSEFAENISKEGMTLASSLTGANLGAIVGSAGGPIGAVVGGVVGGMVASLMSGALYHELKRSVHETKMSEERRKAVEKICTYLIKQEEEYRSAVLEVFDEFFEKKESEIRAGFDSMAVAVRTGNSIHDGLTTFAGAFDLELAFGSVGEFKRHVESGESLKL